jgi:hypothetical protein
MISNQEKCRWFQKMSITKKILRECGGDGISLGVGNNFGCANPRVAGSDIPTDQQIVEEFPDGSEKTLGNSDVIALKPGHRFGRAPKYKRG